MTTASTSKPYTSPENPCGVSAEKVGQIRPKTPLLNILHEAGASGEHFTLKEVMHYLGQYIMLKQLYDQQQQHIVHCGNDALGKVFGVQSFSVKDPSHLYEMLSRNLRTANLQDAAQTRTLVKDTKCLPMREDRLKCPASGELSEEETTACSIPTTSRLKRKNSESDESVTDDQSEYQAKDSISGLWDAAGLPWWFIKSLRTNYGSRKSGSTDIHSNQDIDTAIVSDSTDDLWFLNEPANDQINVEIKLETIEPKEKDACEGQKGEEGKNTDCKEVIEVTIYEADDDLPSSGDATDTEISEEVENSSDVKDSWKCTKCGKCNPLQKQYCLRCWALRKGWHLNPKFVHSTSDPLITGFEETEHEDIDVPDCRKSISEPLIQTAELKCKEKGKHAQCGSSESLERLLQPSTSSISLPGSKEDIEPVDQGAKTRCEESLHFQRNRLGPCLVCGIRPRTGNIIHGKTGHLVACYACAKMLHKRKLPCPVCVQPINTVIRTFIG
ncbi:protein Mdm4 isoform X1 [Carcharodon carcharias]|uniref:protein Mdm4 isoform X1 n=1 Tax=Carcharodon carcharias TaxID=13397 RepID=UPI001B7E77E4|nr:protein Mdm4 isoform X1 [Carcharodon carcharias]